MDLSVLSHRLDCTLANYGGACTCPPDYAEEQHRAALPDWKPGEGLSSEPNLRAVVA
jgi:hypothetical protein